MNLTFGGTHSGCMGLKSIPRTLALGYKSPTVVPHQHFALSTLPLHLCGRRMEDSLSIAQIPVPVPISKIFPGLSPIGAKCNFWHRFTIIACFMSSLSCSLSSFGKLYAPSRNLWYLLPFSKAKSRTLEDKDVEAADRRESVSYPASETEATSDPESISMEACAWATAASFSRSCAACSSGLSS